MEAKQPETFFIRIALRVILVIAVSMVVGVLVWQGITAHGAPDPTQPHIGSTVALFDIGVLVFREGLECVHSGSLCHHGQHGR